MNLLKRWTGLRLRQDWVWELGCQRPTLFLREPTRPGWYLLTVRLQGETMRSYGLFNRNQGRILVNGKQRRRLVRIGKKTQTTRFEIEGLRTPRRYKLWLRPTTLRVVFGGVFVGLWVILGAR